MTEEGALPEVGGARTWATGAGGNSREELLRRRGPGWLGAEPTCQASEAGQFSHGDQGLKRLDTLPYLGNSSLRSGASCKAGRKDCLCQALELGVEGPRGLLARFGSGPVSLGGLRDQAATLLLFLLHR